MSRTGYRVRLALGCACFAAVERLPYGYRLPSWVLAWAGFYAHDDGYDNYMRRAQEGRS